MFGLVLALLVSHLIARRLGVGIEADAFILGRRLITAVTETLNQVVGVVFIPLVAAHAAAGLGLWATVKRAAGPAFLLGLALAVGLSVTAPAIVSAVAGDLSNETKDLAIKVVIALSFALPASVTAMALVSYCNVRGVFGKPAAIKQLPRVAVALTLVTAALGSVATSAAWSYTIASFLVVGVLLLSAFQLSRAPASAEKTTEEKQTNPATFRRSSTAIVMATGALAFLWIETYVAASLGAGRVTMLEFGQRLGALLGNTATTALVLVVFADLSRRAATGDVDILGTVFKKAVGLGYAALLPLTIGVVVNASSLVELILGYGAFQTDAQRETVVLIVQLMAIAPLVSFFYRMMQARIVAQSELPMVRLIGLATVADLILRVVLFGVLTRQYGLVGIPATLIITPVLPCLALAFTLRGKGVFSWTSSSRVSMITPLFASLVVCLAIVLGTTVASVAFSISDPKAMAIAGLLLSAAFGAVTAVGAVRFFKIKPKLG